MSANYATEEHAPTRAEVDAWAEPSVLEFGTDWCGHCRAAQPFIAAAFDAHPAARRVKVEDGKGRKLGRSFGVKLWPTLVFLRHGEEVARVVRPQDVATVARALALLEPTPAA